MSAQAVPQPPQPPEIKRQLKFYPLQLVGMPLIMLIPILALLGVFGLRQDQVSASSAALRMQVEYPTRLRYRLPTTLEVSLENTSEQAMSALNVSFERGYIEKFSQVTFTPDVQEVTDQAYIVVLTNVPPGETRLVTVELEPERLGRYQGSISASAEGTEAAITSLATFVFP